MEHIGVLPFLVCLPPISCRVLLVTGVQALPGYKRVLAHSNQPCKTSPVEEVSNDQFVTICSLSVISNSSLTGGSTDPHWMVPSHMLLVSDVRCPLYDSPRCSGDSTRSPSCEHTCRERLRLSPCSRERCPFSTGLLTGPARCYSRRVSSLRHAHP